MAINVPIVSSFNDRGVVSANKELSLLGKETGRTGALMKSGMLAGAAAIGGVALALKASVEAAIEDQKSQALLAKTLEISAGATKSQVAAAEEWITATSRSSAVADDKLRPALQSLTRATGDITKAQELSALALDISAGSGKSLEAVTAALVKAQNGQLAGLKKFGVPLDANIIKTKDFGAATAALASTFAGAASTAANSFSGRMAGLSIELDEAKETIGAAFIPILMRLLPALSAGARLMAEWAPKIAAVVAVIAKKLEPTIRLLWGAISSLVRAVKAAIEGDWAAAWAHLKTAAANAIGAVVSHLKTVIPILLNLGLSLGQAIVRGIVAGVVGLKDLLISGIKAGLSAAFDALKGALGFSSKTEGKESVAMPFVAGIAEGITAGVVSIKRAAAPIATVIPQALKPAAGAVKAVSNSMDALSKKLEKVRDRFREAFGSAATRALAQFDRAASRRVDALAAAAHSALDALDAERQTETPSERKLRNILADRQDAQRVAVLRGARSALERARAEGDPAAIRSAIEALDAVELDQRIDDLSELAAAERAERDKQFAGERSQLEARQAERRTALEDEIAYQRDQMEASLAALEASLARGERSVGSFTLALAAIFKKFGLDPELAQAGHDLATAATRPLLDAISAASAAYAKLVAQISGGRLAERGGMTIPAVSPIAPIGGIGAAFAQAGASSSAPAIKLTVNAGMGADGADIGRRVVQALRDYSRANGAVPIRVTG